MQHYNFGQASEMVALARYEPTTQDLFLTYHSGPVTIAYSGVSEGLYKELCRSAYPDVCIRFKIQAHHPFRRVEPGMQPLNIQFIK